MTFDTAAWTRERGNFDRHSRRAALVGDLPAAGVVAGAPRATVRTALGEPDASDPGQDIYFLGRGDYAPDTELLVIAYDTNGTIASIGRKQG